MQNKEMKLSRMSELLEESRSAMHAAIEAANIYYFEYFPELNEAAEYNGREHFDLEERLTNYPESWFDKKITHPEDEEKLRAAFSAIKEGADKASCTVRNKMGDAYLWHHYKFTSIYDKAGRRTRVVCTAQDVTESREIEDLNQAFTNMYTRIPGWIFTCKNDEKWTLLRSNPRILDMTGYTREEFLKEKENHITSIVPKEYHDRVNENIRNMEKEGVGASTSYETPLCRKDGKIAWLHVDLYLDRGKDGEILYASCTDITESKKKEEELLESNTMYQLATKNANIDFWEYDIVNDILYNTEDSMTRHDGRPIVKDFIPTILESGQIKPQSIQPFKEMYAKLRAGQEHVSADIWFSGTGDMKWCERINYAVIRDEQGNPVKAFGVGRDITETMESEQRLQNELRFQEGVDNDALLLKARCNVTKDVIEKMNGKDILAKNTAIVRFSEGVRLMEARAHDEKSKKLVRTMFSQHHLEQAMKDSKEITFDYLRDVPEEFPIWMRINIKVLPDPENQDTLAFIYAYNINTEKKLTDIINRIVDIDFEVLALVYAKTNQIEKIRFLDEKSSIGIDYGKSYDDAIQEFIETYVVEDEREEALKAFSLENLRKMIDKNEVYELSFGVKGIENARKKWEFAYFDEEHETIIYTRSDVTDLFKEQEAQKEMLKNALMQAEEANSAKTSFLSRMSHEIRTPMNAIIGMNTLAMQNVNQPNQVRDCLSKVGISARFLLSLINDILDMSRIESGKVAVKKEKFPMEELIYSVNSIFYEQAETKGIDYDCVVANFISDYYVGDAMKLQQVLVNLLGNAIKFTSSGGKVQLIVRQERTARGNAYMSFAVNDTGVGIKEEDIEKIFEPFEQSDTTMTTPYKGTGLGLAIAKNLVTLMGGNIHVNSIEGVGTEFVVNVPLGLCEEDQRYEKLKLSVPVSKLHTLIVDDDVLICEHTKELVEELGMKAQWVTSGYQAVEEVRGKWENGAYFDVILLDWKMPNMDGIETARRIRKIVGDDVTIIVMTAYDWSEIEDAAKQAGVNLLVAKPLFKSSIMSAFETVFQRKEEKKIKKHERAYDFSGKNILLVEDHVLNVEVAKRLLESKHANVVVAENGLRAIETFTEEKDGYFDLILMDIRMPVMDGLTATKAIRQLRKQSAATVPIIAMSANAFDEDIDKSKTAGMNEHLSKPIEPQILYATIHKWLTLE